MNLTREVIGIVVIPESAKAISREGTLAVKEEWIKEVAKEIDGEPQHLCQYRQPAAAFPLEAVKPDTVRYRKPDGQVVEITLPRKPFQLLEFVMGQQGMTEEMVAIAATVWDATYDCTNAIDKAKTKVNEMLKKAEIPFRLLQKNKCISLKK